MSCHLVIDAESLLPLSEQSASNLSLLIEKVEQAGRTISLTIIGESADGFAPFSAHIKEVKGEIEGGDCVIQKNFGQNTARVNKNGFVHAAFERACRLLKVSEQTHCALCSPSMIGATSLFIFLDFDGVMIGDRQTSPLFERIRKSADTLFPGEKRQERHWTFAKAEHLHPTAVTNLHTLIERIESKGKNPRIVISSSWRDDSTVSELQDAFKHYRFGTLICGKTAPTTDSQSWTPEYKAAEIFEPLEWRGDTIEHWLRDHPGEFIVIDDVPWSLERFEERFIQTSDLFYEKHLKQACSVLDV